MWVVCLFWKTLFSCWLQHRSVFRLLSELISTVSPQPPSDYVCTCVCEYVSEYIFHDHRPVGRKQLWRPWKFESERKKVGRREGVDGLERGSDNRGSEGESDVENLKRRRKGGRGRERRRGVHLIRGSNDWGSQDANNSSKWQRVGESVCVWESNLKSDSSISIQAYKDKTYILSN